MTYSESAEGITISKARAMLELKNHGCVMDAQTEAEFVAECGDMFRMIPATVTASMIKELHRALFDAEATA